VADEIRMMMFEISGRAEEKLINNEPPFLEPGMAKLDPETIADKIERQIKKYMPPYVTVQAGIQFEQGSFLLTGTVTLLSWGASIVFDAAKEEIEEQLSGLVKTSVRRIIGQALRGAGMEPMLAPMEMTVTPSVPSTGSLFAPPVRKPIEQPQNLDRPSPTMFAGARFRYSGVVVLVACLLIIQLLLILDRFFEIHPR